MTNLKPFQFFVLTFTNLKSADPRLSSSTGQRGLETAISQLTQVGDPPCVGCQSSAGLHSSRVFPL